MQSDRRERCLDALADAVAAGFVSAAPLKPGAVVERLPREVRRRLEALTSDDARAMRPPKSSPPDIGVRAWPRERA